MPPPSARVSDLGRSKVTAELCSPPVLRYIRVEEEFYPEDRGSRFQQNIW